MTPRMPVGLRPDATPEEVQRYDAELAEYHAYLERQGEMLEMIGDNPKMPFGEMADRLLRLPEFRGISRDDLIVNLALQVWRLCADCPKQ